MSKQDEWKIVVKAKDERNNEKAAMKTISKTNNMTISMKMRNTESNNEEEITEMKAKARKYYRKGNIENDMWNNVEIMAIWRKIEKRQ